ncbi:uncharacterized protein PITG_17472 [Phytophthora infestans T30-4]|uniref:Uncharacterized protein n=1 Tax=Phytophthora infestans (strain T30-4) TaxID=403677 RepID=D0NW46_PHYIT|nr:uncharacterized protein PITG_17472 [Phytophthora infestans T30-4]EEY66888.1 conserved hypothetical protein [Phytophthora infestans T30-4]|eukprot:XP_002896697.1 conserved hypothetical protein [Phytophthora infestans T30-4]
MPTETDRARAASVDGAESTADARARGDGDQDVAAAATTEQDEASELLRLLRGVAGRLDKLEESQVKLEKRLETPKQDPKLMVDTSPFASALGRGSRMHIDSLSGTPQTQAPRRPTVHPQYFGLRHADVGVHETGMSELQRLFAEEHAAQANQEAQQPPAAPVPAQAQATPVQNQRLGVPIPGRPSKEACDPPVRRQGAVRRAGLRLPGLGQKIRAAGGARAVGVRLRVV